MWEYFERIGLIFTFIGFAVLGILSWRQQGVSQKLLIASAATENRLQAVSASLVPITNQQSAISKVACDEECVRTLVNEAVATISGVSQSVKQEVIQRVVERVTVASATTASTQYIPIGSGDTTSTSWSELPGAEVTLDVNDFGQVKQAFFEAQIASPTSGRVFARLWDKRAGNIVIGSEVSHSSGDAKLISTPITLLSGGRTIAVQLRSENGQTVKAISSRLRIDAN